MEMTTTLSSTQAKQGRSSWTLGGKLPLCSLLSKGLKWSGWTTKGSSAQSDAKSELGCTHHQPAEEGPEGRVELPPTYTGLQRTGGERTVWYGGRLPRGSLRLHGPLTQNTAGTEPTIYSRTHTIQLTSYSGTNPVYNLRKNRADSLIAHSSFFPATVRLMADSCSITSLTQVNLNRLLGNNTEPMQYYRIMRNNTAMCNQSCKVYSARLSYVYIIGLFPTCHFANLHVSIL